MASIDERVVAMTFQSASFLAGAAAVISAIQKINMSLASLKGGKALGDLDAAGKKVDLSGIAKGVDDVAKHFSTLGTVATTALVSIASMATMAGARLIKSLTLTPIMSGLDIYSTKLNAMQTILANTMGQAGSNLGHVTQALNQLNDYSNKTIYSFGEMAKNIGLFTAAGVKIDTSVASIKGLANIAALSGASSQQAASAMYQMSQAIASGTVRLMDWNSVVNAGMGGKVFQNALIETARVHGVAVDQMIKKDGSFRDSLQEGWLTAKIMTETLSKFTGDMSDAQLKALGYTDKQIKAIQRQAQAAVDAAVKVRTVSQLFDVMKDSIATAWAGVFEAILGNLPQATKLLTGIAGGLSKVFVAPVQHLGALLMRWNELGGRAYLIQGLTRAMGLFGQILHPIGQAFRDVFPPTTAQHLVDMTKSFRDFIMNIHISQGVINGIRGAFQGLFSAVKIVWDVFKGVVSVIGTLIHAATGLGGGLVGAAGGFGHLIDNARKWLESGNRLQNFFQNLGTILSAPVQLLGAMGHVLGALASGAVHALAALGPFFQKVADGFSKLGDAIANGIKSGNISGIMGVINQGIFGAILLAVRHFIGNFSKAFGGGFGLVDQIKSIFGGLTSTLQAMQNNLNAGTLQKIAIAVALLTASVIGLSLVNPGKLAAALGALTTMFTEMLGAMAIIAKIGAGKGIFALQGVALAMDLLAGSMLILAGAVMMLSGLSWSELAKGLIGVAGAMVILIGAVKLIGKDPGKLIAAAAAMVLIAVAMNLMATSIRILAGLDWGGIAKGLTAVAALLAMLALFNRFGGVQLISTGIALIAIGVALNIIALALKQMGALSWGEIGKGMVTLAGSLLIIAGAMALMTEGLAGAAALLVMSVALVILSNALNSLGGMSWGAIAKSLVELAGALLILALAMAAMTGGIAGAFALLVMAAALAVLAPVLVLLGSLSWAQLLTGLFALAAVFLLLGAAGVLLAPLVPAILGLAAALIVLGAGIALIGAGIFLLGLGLTAIGVALLSAGTAILTFVTGLLNLIPLALTRIGQGIVAFAGVIAKSGAAITAAFVTLISSLLNAIIKVMPLIGRAIDSIMNVLLNTINKWAPRILQTMANLLLGLLSTIASKMPQFIQKGTDIVVSMLNGIARNAGRIVAAGVSAVVSFINGISANIGRIVNAGVNLAINFVNGVANSIRSHEGEMRSAGANLGSAIVSGAISGIGGMVGGLISAAVGAARSAVSAMWNAIRAHSPSKETELVGIAFMQGFISGINGHTSHVEDAATNAALTALTALNDTIASMPELQALEITITPVIDLSKAQKGFDDLSAMAMNQVVPATSANAAANISVGGGPGGENAMVAVGGTNISLVQNNSSPKALSAAEIYRQTRNQLSTLRGALPG